MFDLEINVAAFQKSTRVVGPSVRDALWVQGCRIGCSGCANQSYLPHVKQRLIPVSRLLDHFRCRVGKIDGLSVLGGEPTEQPDAVSELLAGVKALGLSTVVFTGRLLQDLKREDCYIKLLANTDLLIDGPFRIRQSDHDLYWRGSSNQQFHRLSDFFSLEDLESPSVNGEIIIKEDNIFLNGIGTIPIQLSPK